MAQWVLALKMSTKLLESQFTNQNNSINARFTKLLLVISILQYQLQDATVQIPSKTNAKESMFVMVAAIYTHLVIISSVKATESLLKLHFQFLKLYHISSIKRLKLRKQQQLDPGQLLFLPIMTFTSGALLTLMMDINSKNCLLYLVNVKKCRLGLNSIYFYQRMGRYTCQVRFSMRVKILQSLKMAWSI